ncbi:hypothetical protein KC19_1G020000 [Ceratodon purpureus]|uniref:F-box domain-containing protein n=1 Tax=Ceratodon purpureus TaxID=3225 RepID=A0A8T0J3R4_CERPU|nr:hypothetical protein KC19_1G020000 [Ceratodon purpureus]
MEHVRFDQQQLLERHNDFILRVLGSVANRERVEPIAAVLEDSYEPCPNSPRSAGMANLDDVLCVRKLCPNCTAAGCVWTTSFGTTGYWRKVRRELEVAVGPTLDPEIWEQLQPDLLGHVLARLPTDGIGRVRALSKAWNTSMSTSSLVAKQCAEAQPNLHALMGFSVVTRECWVRAYDTRACKWHAYSIPSIPKLYASSISSSDAGLACFVPHRGDEDLVLEPVLVCNPLTREWKQLPMQRLVLKQACMVQLRVDRGTGSYSVTLVGRGTHVYEGVAEVYNSKTGEWSAVVSEGKVVDYFWSWPPKDLHDLEPRTLGVFDSSTQQLLAYREEHFPTWPLTDSEGQPLEDLADGYWEVRGLAIHGNDLYVLESFPHSEEDRESTWFNVAKYEEGCWGFGSTGLPTFTGHPEIVELEMDFTHAFGETLFVCKTFFLVVGSDKSDQDIFQVTLYDVESGEWLPQFEIVCDEEWPNIMHEEMNKAFLCELLWDASP